MKSLIWQAILLPGVAVAQWVFFGDTIGGTTYDRQFNGPSQRTVYFDPTLGVHAIWMYSDWDQEPFPDRNVRYNFCDLGAQEWVFNQGSNFMDFGVNVFPMRSGYGTLDINPMTGCAYVAAHADTAGRCAVAARDAAPGSGTFDPCLGPAGHYWPGVGLTQDERVHIVTSDVACDTVFYSAVEPWGTWSQPVPISEDLPMWPNACLEVARPGNKVAIAWVKSDELPYQCFYRVSTNGGRDWEPEIELAAPPAFTPGSDTTPSFAWCGHGLLWDSRGDLHIVAALFPVVAGTGYVLPAEIWHYCPENTPSWSRIARAGCDTGNLMGTPGYNAIYACRPMLTLSGQGLLHCVWEQFDSMNLEASTGCLRADIYAAQSRDNGWTWSYSLQATVSDRTSHCYPSLARERSDDIVSIVYLRDLIAGSFVQGQGAVSNNPVIYLHGPYWGPGVAERALLTSSSLRLVVAPNPASREARVRIRFSADGKTRLTVRDATGRVWARLIDDNLETGKYGRVWQPGTIPEGVYFVRLETGRGLETCKLVVTR